MRRKMHFSGTCYGSHIFHDTIVTVIFLFLFLIVIDVLFILIRYQYGFLIVALCEIGTILFRN